MTKQTEQTEVEDPKDEEFNRLMGEVVCIALEPEPTDKTKGQGNDERDQ